MNLKRRDRERTKEREGALIWYLDKDTRGRTVPGGVKSLSFSFPAGTVKGRKN